MFVFFTLDTLIKQKLKSYSRITLLQKLPEYGDLVASFKTPSGCLIERFSVDAFVAMEQKRYTHNIPTFNLFTTPVRIYEREHLSKNAATCIFIKHLFPQPQSPENSKLHYVDLLTCSYHQISSIPVCTNTAESTSDKWNLSSLDRLWRRHISSFFSLKTGK